MYVGEVPKDELWDIININVGATTLMTRTVIAGMKKRRRGAIVNVSSGSEFQPLPLMTVYAATKVYLKSFSEALRAEYEKFGITVQHLTPLFVNTKMNSFSARLQVQKHFFFRCLHEFFVFPIFTLIITGIEFLRTRCYDVCEERGFHTRKD